MHSSVVLRPEKGPPVPDYRIQILTFDNKIAGPAVEVDCQSDAEAVAKARTLLNGQDIEIWSGTRIVTRLRFVDASASPGPNPAILWEWPPAASRRRGRSTSLSPTPRSARSC